MGVLTRKLWRNIVSTRGQFLAVAAVMALGVAFYVSMTTAYANLERAQQDFYQQDNFADYYFQAVQAPESITRQIALVPGVIAATGRIQEDVPVIKADGSRADARLTSFPLPMTGAVNRLSLLSGRLFDEYPQGGRVEVLLDPGYAAANHLAPGDTVNIIAAGREIPLTVVGTATSPEFVYPIKDAASLLPDPLHFGIFMIPTNQAQDILGLDGQINQVVVRLAPGADQEEIAARIESVLQPYGNLASYPRSQQSSNSVLQSKIDSIRTLANFLPAVFLGIAALIQFIMLGRMIRAQRTQIGVMKALGYGDLQIMLHYTGYALLIGLLGAVLGIGLGLAMASAVSAIYAQYFNLPQAIGGFNSARIIDGFILSLGVAAAAGLWAARGAAAIRPAESLQAEAPLSARRVALEAWPWLWNRLDAAWRISLRTVNRNRVRAAVTLLGVIFAVSLIVVSFFAKDTIEYLFTQYFNQDLNYDYLVTFTRPVRQEELLNISRIGGVYRVEPVFNLPVKFFLNGREQDSAIVGLPPGDHAADLQPRRPAVIPAPGRAVPRRQHRRQARRRGGRRGAGGEHSGPGAAPPGQHQGSRDQQAADRVRILRQPEPGEQHFNRGRPGLRGDAAGGPGPGCRRPGGAGRHDQRGRYRKPPAAA